MLGRILDRGWIVLLISASFLGTSKWCEAKQMPDPDLLMSETGLMLLVIDDVPGTMVKAKKFFDGVYKEHREKGVLGPLQTPMTQYIFQQAQGDQPTHWLIKAVDSIATEGTELEKVWRPIAEKLAKDPTQVTPEEEDEVIAAFARLFKGKMFIGEEDYKPYRTTIFGFEYDPEVFDWMKELRLVAERQRERYGYENQSAVISGVEVVHLPNEGWFVFSVNNVVFGVVEREFDKTAFYVNRAVHLSKRNDPNWSPLRGDRRFQRSYQEALEANNSNYDVYLYLDWKNQVRRTFVTSSALRPEQKRGMGDVDMTRYDVFSCFSCTCSFSESGDEFIHCYYYHLTEPLVDRINYVFKKYAPMDLNRLPPISESTRSSLSFNPSNIDGLESRLPDVRNRSQLISARLPHAATDPKEWRKLPPDVFSLLEQIVSESKCGATIGYQLLTVPHESVNYYFPVAVLPVEVAVSSESLLERIRQTMQSSQNESESILSVHGAGSFDVPWKTPAYDKLPDFSLLDGEAFDTGDTEHGGRNSLRVLKKSRTGTSDVTYVGTKNIQLVLIEDAEYLFVIPCVSEFGIAELVNEISSARHVVHRPATEFTKLIQPHDRVIQVSFHTQPGYRTAALEMGLSQVAYGTFPSHEDNSNYVADFLNEDMSILKSIYRLYVDVVSTQSDIVERSHFSMDRTHRSVQWLRVVIGRNDNLVQIGSMKLPNQ